MLLAAIRISKTVQIPYDLIAPYDKTRVSLSNHKEIARIQIQACRSISEKGELNADLEGFFFYHLWVTYYT